MLIGFEARNAPHLTAEDWERIDALGSTCIKIRSYHCIPETIAGITQRNLSVILRPSSDGDLNPSDRYFEMGEALTKLLDAGVQEIVLLPDSEPNLHDKPMPADYWNRVATFFVLIDRHFSQYAESGRLKYASPPLAVAQGNEAWLQAATVKRMVGMNAGDVENLLTGFDYFTVHAYGQTDTSLVQRGIDLARIHAPGIPMVAAEVGDSSNADAATKAEAIIQYLTLLKEAGAYAACLFIVGSSDPQWAGFVLPVDQIRRIGAAFAQEAPMAVTIEQRGIPTTTPGGVVEMPVRITGITETPLDLVAFDLAYPVIPGTDESRYGGNALGRTDAANDGDYVLRGELAPLAVPLPGPVMGEMRGNVLSHTGGTIGNVPFGPFYFAIVPHVPVPEPAPLPVHDPNVDLAYYHITNGYNALIAAKDDLGADQMKKLELHLLYKFKGEGASDPLTARK